jgi:hypothetical protein
MKRNSDSVKNRGRSSKTAPVLTAKLKCKQAALQCIVLLGMLMLADAQTTSWNVATGDWNVNANWTNSVPSSSSIAIIADGGMVTISASDMAQTMTLDIGGNGSAGSSGASGALLLSGGTLTVSSGDLTLGGVANGGAGGTGTLNLDSGTLTAQSINVTSNGSLNFGPGAGQTVTVNTSISGLSGQTVTCNTTGIVLLNGVADFGAVALNAGTLKVSADNALGKSTGGLTLQRRNAGDQRHIHDVAQYYAREGRRHLQYGQRDYTNSRDRQWHHWHRWPNQDRARNAGGIKQQHLFGRDNDRRRHFGTA